MRKEPVISFIFELLLILVNNSEKLNINISDIGELISAKKNTVSFFSNINYQDQLKKTNASVLFTKEIYKYLIPKT